MYYCIDNPLLHIYPTRTLRCVSFALVTIFLPSECSTDVPHPWQGFVSFHVCYSYCPFLFTSFLCSLSLTISTTSAYQTQYTLAKNPYHFILTNSPPLKMSHERSELKDVQAKDTRFWHLMLSFLSELSLNHSKSDLK